VVGTLVTVDVDWIGIALVDEDADGRKVSFDLIEDRLRLCMCGGADLISEF
jgi:hypothetical protein